MEGEGASQLCVPPCILVRIGHSFVRHAAPCRTPLARTALRLLWSVASDLCEVCVSGWCLQGSLAEPEDLHLGVRLDILEVRRGRGMGGWGTLFQTQSKSIGGKVVPYPTKPRPSQPAGGWVGARGAGGGAWVLCECVSSMGAGGGVYKACTMHECGNLPL